MPLSCKQSPAFGPDLSAQTTYRDSDEPRSTPKIESSRFQRDISFTALEGYFGGKLKNSEIAEER